eukprot:scaffold13382_cov132-Isochrysis_galbana.AAC.1
MCDQPFAAASGVDTRPPAASHPTPPPKMGRRVVSRGRARRASAHMRLQPSLLRRGHAPPSVRGGLFCRRTKTWGVRGCNGSSFLASARSPPKCEGCAFS